MNHIGLFEGIGGFSLAARWMGWETIAWCEWNEFGQQVLRHHFPEAEGHGDIKQTDFTIYRGRCDILTGGFPCQPYSTAGKRLGKEDDRHLWPEMLRAIREIGPTWVVGENVRGLVNWNGGMVFDEVQADLEAEGYEVQPFLLPACAVNAPHRRDRIWFVAYAKSQRAWKQPSENRGWQNRRPYNNGENADAPNSNGGRQPSQEHRQKESGRTPEKGFSSNWKNFPTVAPVLSGNDGIPRELDSISFPKWRNESIKAAGNAIVPQVAYQIFKAIKQYNDGTTQPA